MAKYGVELTKAITSVTVGLGSIEAAAANPRREAIYDTIYGSAAAPPNDNVFLFEWNRTTTASTGTAVTPNALDPADPAAVALAKQNNTVNGTNTAGAIPLAVPLNQRSTFRWVAKDGSELIIPAVAANGFEINTPTAQNTPAATVAVLFEER
jgi:hypothetical protein